MLIEYWKSLPAWCRRPVRLETRERGEEKEEEEEEHKEEEKKKEAEGEEVEET